MSLEVIILIVILGVYNLPGSTIILRNQKINTDKYTDKKQQKLAKIVDKNTMNKLVSANNQFGFKLFS
ncbi:MAG: hypothetical protein F6K18_04475 [Okeania sp. SIO2C2]|uniref:hypothetical protein n=1 Tax=Okeania sp. SIO2C2 TaxID=2607787 RepID=UPI0013B77C59|nr:hypothetical protein [Okeania sp. SIO2C2]NEP86132.1 hypothetical protein [Okeania sp. SIO2C2]